MIMSEPEQTERECLCRKCGHLWTPRAQKPQACPRCKRYDWEQGKQKVGQAERADKDFDFGA